MQSLQAAHQVKKGSGVCPEPQYFNFKDFFHLFTYFEYIYVEIRQLAEMGLPSHYRGSGIKLRSPGSLVSAFTC